MATNRRDKGRLERTQSIFMRIVALVFLVLALQAWMRVTGLSAEGRFRFDVIDDHWRLVSSVMCVLLPVAALGLWAGQAWGAVLWIAAASLTIATHGLLPDLFGRADFLIGFHVLGLLTMAGFRTVIALVANKR